MKSAGPNAQPVYGECFSSAKEVDSGRCEELLLDVIAGLCTESSSVQMRSTARGSDGLAEVGDEDLENVVLPKIEDPHARVVLHPFVNALIQGLTGVEDAVRRLNAEGELPVTDPRPRTSHVQLV